MPSIYADTVIRNANVITIDNSRPRAEALAMLHGRFAAVGSADDVAGLGRPGYPRAGPGRQDCPARLHRRPHSRP